MLGRQTSLFLLFLFVFFFFAKPSLLSPSDEFLLPPLPCRMSFFTTECRFFRGFFWIHETIEVAVDVL